MLEYYGFFLYATAASLVLGPLYFPANDSSITSLAIFASVGIGFIARPIGALALGIIGDTLGRRLVLGITLFVMGASTFLIGVLPTHQDIGVLAPLMLIVFRFLQGLAVSGQHSGTSSLALELSDAGRRGFYTSSVLSGTQAGLILASGCLLLPSVALSPSSFAAWGWRIPFLLGFVIVGFGLWTQSHLPESPSFASGTRTSDTWLTPLRHLLCHCKRDSLLVIAASQVSVVSSIVGVYSLALAVNVSRMSMTTMLSVQLTSALVGVFTIPAWAHLSDKIGRRPVFLLGTVLSAILIWPYFLAIDDANVHMTFVFGILLSGIAYGAVNGVWPAMYGEMFATRIRITGMASTTQIGFALTAQAPLAATFLTGESSDWSVAPWITSIGCLVSVLAVLRFPETSRINVDELGSKP
ncbi:Predicted arabinose efflux permease, MFS family [Propionivibrio dicarboxylicus]|uniref:Predicted arabinose efflux permease, MFS family n=2 Tax=Propionivibrio dicarboxylicus TaxID=83767 RepID=A0A1G8AK73_9RHOO|nr:Predicted arabinose efflux permease, MFS family [Propionivibrio dicarboxylicus]